MDLKFTYNVEISIDQIRMGRILYYAIFKSHILPVEPYAMHDTIWNEGFVHNSFPTQLFAHIRFLKSPIAHDYHW